MRVGGGRWAVGRKGAEGQAVASRSLTTAYRLPPTAHALRLAGRVVMLQVGLLLYGLALSLGYRAGLGLHAWGLFQNALTKCIPLTYGQVTILVGAVFIGVSWLAKIPPGFGTVCNMIFVGTWLDFFNARLPQAPNWPVGLAMLLIGIATLGFASGLYIKAGLGAGPRDSFMLAVMRWTSWRVGLARAVIEGTVFVVGAILDLSHVGIGTVVYTLGVGPAVDLAFRLLRVGTEKRAEGGGQGAGPGS
jgi:uncharacterized membrane protein YczE